MPTLQIRLLAFWDKTEKEETLVVASHGFIKKTQKTPKSEIENNTKDVRLSTIMKVFNALKAKVKMTIDFDANSHLEIA